MSRITRYGLRPHEEPQTALTGILRDALGEDVLVEARTRTWWVVGLHHRPAVVTIERIGHVWHLSHLPAYMHWTAKVGSMACAIAIAREMLAEARERACIAAAEALGRWPGDGTC